MSVNNDLHGNTLLVYAAVVLDTECYIIDIQNLFSNVQEKL